MSEVKTEHQNVLNEFMSRALKRRIQVTRVINFKSVETSNSIYTTLECNHYWVYELAISDHRNYNHYNRLGDTLGKGPGRISRHRLRDDMFGHGIRVPNIHTLDKNNYYSITACRPYRMNPKDLVGRYSAHLAFMSDYYEVQDALLLDNKQVLMITYTDPDHTDTAHGYYVNYNPIKKGCTARDIVAIKYLKANYDIKTARRIFFHSWYDLQTMEEYHDNDSSVRHTPHIVSNYQYQNSRQLMAQAKEEVDHTDTFEMDGQKYVFSLEVANPQIVLES